MSDLADQINAAHQEVIKGFNKGTLDHAIKAGELLNIARENVKATKGKWTDWLAENCPDIPQRTVHLYRQLATHKDHLKNWQRVAKPVNEELSLRGALKLIPKSKRAKPAMMEATKAAEVAKAAEAAKAAVEPEAAYGPTIEDMLDNMAPDELFNAVTKTWDEKQVEKLALMLVEHMRSLLKQEAADEPPPPSMSVQQFERRA